MADRRAPRPVSRAERPGRKANHLHCRTFEELPTGRNCEEPRARLGEQPPWPCVYSTVTLFAKLRGWSTSHPRRRAIERASSCSGTLAVMAENASRTFGM